ncbi:MAG: hypothetical protein ACYTAF_14770 [Planctomycetota bacterium]|jgi:hypothetical protein
MRSWIARSALFLALLLGMAAPAQALRCKQWVGLDAGGRAQALEAAVDDVLESPRAKSFTSINKGRIRACMMQRSRSIAIDFDDACAQGMAAPMNVLDEILMDYVRSCVN